MKIWQPKPKQPCHKNGYLQSASDMIAHRNRFQRNPWAKVGSLFVPKPLRMSPGYPCCCEEEESSASSASSASSSASSSSISTSSSSSWETGSILQCCDDSGGGFFPDSVQVNFSGYGTNGSCANCTSINGTFSLPWWFDQTVFGLTYHHYKLEVPSGGGSSCSYAFTSFVVCDTDRGLIRFVVDLAVPNGPDQDRYQRLIPITGNQSCRAYTEVVVSYWGHVGLTHCYDPPGSVILYLIYS